MSCYVVVGVYCLKSILMSKLNKKNLLQRFCDEKLEWNEDEQHDSTKI